MTKSKGIHAVYARYSSDRQGEATIELQIEQCEKQAGRKLTVYADRARSGVAMAHRSELLRLLDDAENGRIEAVWVYKLDRIGRNVGQTATIVDTLQECGVEVHSCDGTADTPLVRNIMLSVADDFSRVLSGRVYDAMTRAARQGRSFLGGRAPYGYRVTEREGHRELEINQDEADIIRLIFKLYVDGLGFKSIASELQQRGVAPRRTKHWRFTTVRSMLINPLYAGRVTYNKRRYRRDRRTGRKRITWKDESEHITHLDEALRIVDDATFDAVAERMTGNKSSAHAVGGGHRRAFTNLAHCPHCGHVLYSQFSRGGYRYLRCGHKYATGGKGCSCGISIREDVLLAEITGYLLELEASDPASIVADVVKILQAGTQRDKQEAARLRRQVAHLRAETTNMARLLADPDITDAAKRGIAEALAQTQADKEAAEARLSDLLDDAQMNSSKLIKLTEACLVELREGLQGGTHEHTRLNSLIERFVGPFVVTADKRITPLEGPSDNRQTWRRQWDSNPR